MTAKDANHAKTWSGTPPAPVPDSVRMVRGSSMPDHWSTHNYYHADGNGNVTYLVNNNQTKAAAYRYDPFGNTLSSSGSLASANVYRFSSKELHGNSGLYYYGYRFYDPNTQTWLNRDPIHEAGGINLYAHTLSNPINLYDPDGLACENPCAEAVGNGDAGTDVGGVVCCGRIKYSCVWLSGGATGATNPKARSIIDACTMIHEDEHHDDIDCGCSTSTTRPPFRDPNRQRREECKSYQEELECLKNANCGGDPECERQVRAERREVSRRVNATCGVSISLPNNEHVFDDNFGANAGIASGLAT